MKKLSTILVALTAIIASTMPLSAAEKLNKIGITYVSSPFNVPSIVMRAKGFLDDEFKALNIKVESPEITSGAKQIQALAAGEIQIASVLGGASAILGSANGVDVKIIAVYSRSPKAFFIMTGKDGSTDIKSLKGKSVAGPKGTTLHQLLASALAKNGMKLSDINHVNMDLPAARAALLAGKVDAATLAGNNALAVEEAGGKILVSGEDYIQPTTVIAVRGDLIKNHPEVVKAYLSAHKKALTFMKEHSDEALKLAADEQKISFADAKRMLEWYDFSIRMNDADVANLEADQDFMLESDMLKKKIDIRAQLIDPSAFTIE
ncbi:aliphatic sulfonate ABC transporter substrate-binding protein [Microvirga sp. W0021]|uniref:Aliphatic sulfonate ABC transporter substrate-binding protein n=1 Tax=Hohaiivirga grylli TaxID=3133970 RepID=A0ABV0BK41_9HYPH